MSNCDDPEEKSQGCRFLDLIPLPPSDACLYFALTTPKWKPDSKKGTLEWSPQVASILEQRLDTMHQMNILNTSYSFPSVNFST